MNCPNCNHPLAPNGKFCPVCGTPVVSEEFSSAKTQVMEDMPPTQEYAPQQPSPYGNAAQEPSPAAGESPQQYGDSYQQSAGYQPPAAPDAYDYQPPAQQQSGYNQYQPQQNDYSEQFRQYQQPSQYGASNPSQPNGKPNMNKKNNMPLIIVLIVLAVLLVGGAIFAVIMIVNSNKGGSQPATSPTAAVTTTVNGSSSKAQSSAQQQTSAQEQTSAQSSREESSQAQTSAQSSREESSQAQQSGAAPYSGSHAVKNSAGVTLAEADSIHADDKEAEAKLKQYMTDSKVETTMEEDSYSGVIYIQGNAVVYELTMKVDVTEAQKQSLQTYLEEDISELSPSLKEGREESGVADMVIVYAYIAKDGSLIAGGVCDK